MHFVSLWFFSLFHLLRVNEMTEVHSLNATPAKRMSNTIAKRTFSSRLFVSFRWHSRAVLFFTIHSIIEFYSVNKPEILELRRNIIVAKSTTSREREQRAQKSTPKWPTKNRNKDTRTMFCSPTVKNARNELTTFERTEKFQQLQRKIKMIWKRKKEKKYDKRQKLLANNDDTKRKESQQKRREEKWLLYFNIIMKK